MHEHIFNAALIEIQLENREWANLNTTQKTFQTNHTVGTEHFWRHTFGNMVCDVTL